MNILLPKEITPAMLMAGTNIPAVDAYVDEVAWASGADCAVGDRRVRGNYVYECIKKVEGSPANTYAPDTANGGEFWFKDETNPTNRWAPFDEYIFTKARALGEVKYVIKPGFVNGIAIHGVEADSLTITVTDGDGGSELMPPFSVDMWEQAYGLWEYLFGDLRRNTKGNLKGLPIHPNMCITIIAARTLPTEEAAIAYISVGQWQQLLAPDSLTSATVTGAAAELKSYSYYDERSDGTYVRKRGRQANDLSINCTVKGEEGNRVRDVLSRVLDLPVAMESVPGRRFAWLSTVGFITGRISAPSNGYVELDIKVKGNV